MRGMILLLAVMLTQSVFAGGKGSGRHSTGATYAPPATEQPSYSVTPACSTGKLCGNACIPVDHQCGESRAAPPKSISSNGSPIPVTASNAPIQKPQTYLYEWYSPFSGIKTWSGEPPNYMGDIQPKTVCIWQESASLGCVDYSIPENRWDLLNKAAAQKRQAAEYEIQEATEAIKRAKEQHKELLAGQSREIKKLLYDIEIRESKRRGMHPEYIVADRILEVAELLTQAQKHLTTGTLDVAQQVVSRMQINTALMITPKTSLDKLMSSSEAMDRDIANRAQVTLQTLGLSQSQLSDRDITASLTEQINHIKSAVEDARKLATPTTP